MTRILTLILAGVLATPALAGDTADAINNLTNQLQFEGLMNRMQRQGGGYSTDHQPWRKAELFCQDRIVIYTDADRPEYERCLRRMTEWFKQ